MVAVHRYIHKGHPGKNVLTDTLVTNIIEDNIIDDSERIETRVTKEWSQEFIGTDSHIIIAWLKLDELLLNSQFHVHSGTALEFSWNHDSGNKEYNGDRSGMIVLHGV